MSTLWEKDTPKSEWKKIKHLTFKEKLEYIWNYYKWPICIIIVLISFIIIWADAFKENQKDTFIRGAMINKFEFLVTNSVYFPETYAAFRELDPEKQNAELNINYVINEEYRKETTTTYQNLMAQIMSKELDFMASDQETLASYNKLNSVFSDLRAVLPTELFEQLDTEGRIVWMHEYTSQPSQTELIESEEKYPLLINFSDSHLTTGLKLRDKELYVAFIINSKNVDEFPYFIEYMLNYVAPEEPFTSDTKTETKNVIATTK